MNTRVVAACALAGLLFAALTACGGGSNTGVPLPLSSSVPVEPPSYAYSMPDLASAEPSSPEPEISAMPDLSSQAFPAGYPKVVAVKSLPDQVENWYRMSDYPKAVAVAPGVWTALPPGATVQDAVASGTLDGFCASIKAYERRYLGGADEAGTCW